MANPQTENGHIDIANEIAERLCRLNLSPYQWRVLWAIWRKTYGWHKKGDKVAQTQLVELTGLAKPHLNRALHQLVAANLVIKLGKYLAFQKDYDHWKVTSRDNLPQKLPAEVTEVTSRGNKKLPVEVTSTTKEKKETIQKKLYKSVFDFWNQQNIIVHRRLTDDVRNVIVRTLRSYSVEEVCKAIANYAEIVNGEEYYWTHKWTLFEFLKRGVERFMDGDVARANFKEKKDAKAGARPVQRIYTEPD